MLTAMNLVVPFEHLAIAHGDAQGARRRFWTTLTVIVLLAGALRVAIAIHTGLTDPGALMTLRFSENIAGGNGFVYNVGERVLGTTTPLFALLVAGGMKLGFSPIGFADALGVVGDLGLCVAVAAWLRALGFSRAGLLAAALVAVSPRLVHWSVTGTEESLVTLGIATALFALAARRDLLSPRDRGPGGGSRPPAALDRHLPSAACQPRATPWSCRACAR